MWKNVSTRCWGWALILGSGLPVSLASTATAGNSMPGVTTTALSRPLTRDDAQDSAGAATWQSLVRTADQSPFRGLPASPLTPAPTAPGTPATPAPKPPPFEIAWTVQCGTDAESWHCPPHTAAPVELVLGTRAVLISGIDWPLEAHALEDGHMLWTSPLALSAVLALDGLVVGFDAGQLRAVDEVSGQVRWSAPVGEHPKQATIAEGLVVVASGTELRAYRVSSGDLAWTMDFKAAPTTRAAVDGARGFVALADNSIAAFDWATGRQSWRVATDAVPRELTASGDRLFFGSERNFACSYRQRDGQRAWCFPIRAAAIGTPLADAKRVYFAFFDNTVRAFNRNSGSLVERHPLLSRPTDGPRAAGAFIAIPDVTGGVVLLNAADGTLNVRLAPPGDQTAWRLAAAAAPSGQWLTSLTISPGDIRMLTTHRLRASATPAPVANPAAPAQAPAGRGSAPVVPSTSGPVTPSTPATVAR